MRTRMTYVLGIAATLGVLALGFMLPSLTGRVQDRVLGAETSTQDVQRVTLAKPDSNESMIDLLRFAAQGYETMALGETTTSSGGDNELVPGNANIIGQEATEFLQILNAQGIDFLNPNQFEEVGASSSLATNGDSDNARLLWKYDMWDEESSTHASLIIDDVTGKVVSFTIAGRNVGGPALFTWIDALTNYYGFTTGELNRMKEFEFTDGSGESVECDFMSEAMLVQFNRNALESFSLVGVDVGVR